MLGLLPLGGKRGYGVGIGSYDQHITFSMMSDARMMPDAEQMKAFVQATFDNLRQRYRWMCLRIGSRDPGRGCLTPHAGNAAKRAGF